MIYHGDLDVCLLEGGYSKVERTLAERGRGDAVTEQRSQYQAAVKDEFKAAIEELTCRRPTSPPPATRTKPRRTSVRPSVTTGP